MIPSVRSVTKDQTLRQTFLREVLYWQQSLRVNDFRGLVHISGSQKWALQQAKTCIEHLGFPAEDVFFLNRDAPTTINKAKCVLGQQFSAVLVNGYQGLHANAIALVAGTIKAGGVLVLVSPRMDDWLIFDDPDLQRFIANDGHYYPPSSSVFIRRFIEQLSLIEHASFDEVDGITFPNKASLSFSNVTRKNTLINASDKFQQQGQAIEAIKKVCTGHAKRPLVLLADRGRGKSAALGIAAAQLMQEKPCRIIVTAPNKEALNSFYAHLSDGLAISSDESVITVKIDNKGVSRCQFVAVDALYLHAADYRCDVLLIDEAAALPTHVLKRLTQQNNRIVFSTTTQGYEGNGQGFMLRFAKVLDEMMPQWRRYDLTEALRYNNDDPLESWLNQTFLLANTRLDLNVSMLSEVIEKVTYHSISQQQLVSNEALLQKLFYLLVTAHYQTSPDDLRGLIRSAQF